MEDLWRVEKMGYRMGEYADRAEYNKLLQRYRDEEEASNRHHLLFLGEKFGQIHNR